MPATVTLSTTTLTEAISATQRQIKLASTSGVLPGLRLYLEGELMAVDSLGPSSAYVNVRRGQDGTAGAVHSSSATVYIGRADQYYFTDPKGSPPDVIPVSPYINAKTGQIWYAQGDALPGGATYRWWQREATTYGIGALGERERTLDPTSSS